MANALKKITTAAKAIRKKSPGTSWKSAVKKAGAMYRGGKLKAKKKRAVATKRKTTKRATVRRKSTSRKKVGSRKPARRTVMVITGAGRLGKATRKRRRSAPKRKSVSRRRVGSSRKDNFIKTLAIAGLGIGLLVAFTRQRQATTPLYQNTGNNYRDSRAQQILSYASAAGLAASQIINLINRINQSSDAQLDQMNQGIQSGNTPVTAYA